MKQCILILLLLGSTHLWPQSYTSYLTGDGSDAIALPTGGTCLMGGATENDEAMTWFLNRADGGDILVLRASGSDGYNTYLYTDLGVTVNSVETIVFNNPSAAGEAYVQQRIAEAEAIWFAGGDQWNYVNMWRNTAIDSLINAAVNQRNCVIGGTSAGMAILGETYFSAEFGTVTSNQALSNPYRSEMAVDDNPFLDIPFLESTITDTHYDSPDRKGRHLAFLARMVNDGAETAHGIACDEYTAVCIDTDGMAYAFGESPTYDDNVYFLTVNCELTDPLPENCSPGQALDWNQGAAAVKVYHIEAAPGGSNYFDLNDWETGSGGNWKNWWASTGSFNESTGLQPDCTTNPPTGIKFPQAEHIDFIINPYTRILSINSQEAVKSISLFSLEGRSILETSPGMAEIRLPNLPAGLYGLRVETEGISYSTAVFIPGN